MTTRNTKTFNVVSQNIAATKDHYATRRWMNSRPQICWKCQQDKPMKGGTIKMFGTVRRFICVDCVLTKQVEIARAKGELS